ncbi:MAG: TRAP transporter substrate-binding protein [Beijerinckiaceae bacterium]|nr:TRAP transporter substrate-binding protein [Beijerinckiaceae bacterium]
MHTTRRTFLGGAAVAGAASGLGLSVGPAFAAEELKLATFVPNTHIIMAKVLTPWAEKIAKDSGGQLAVRMFPSMQLGGKPPELYRQMARGISDICFTLPGYTSGDFPMMALTELPGMADSGVDGTRKIWANFDKFLAREFTEAKVLGLWNSDSAALMSKNKPIRTLEDLRGLKIRTPSAAQSAQLTALGATPIDMPANQIYNNLDRGVVDAAMIPMSAAIDFKLIEVARYFTLDAPLGRSNFLVAMNRARYDRLPANLRKMIDDTTGLEMSLQGARTYDEQNDAGVAAARKDREVITLDAAERKRWLDAFKPHINERVAEGEKAGLPARGLVTAYGLIS